MSPKLRNSVLWLKLTKTGCHSSTNPENLAKIGLADLDIIGLTKVVKKSINKKQKTEAEHKSAFGCCQAV